MSESTSRVLNYSLEYLVGERFGRYSKYVIQERALPDARDGLKPVQRRILYAMHVDGNTAAKPFRKSAKTVGTVIGNYHPHGDSSVYEAMVRMSQWWKMGEPLVEMHGNNGSLDDDPPAAMRYTEARLSKLSGLLLQDIEKDTILWAPNFDDTTLEPTVLPARFPNLLVNGARGIASGYATFIPTHNLAEVIQATIHRIKNPDCTLDEIIACMPGPDFSTGGIVRGKEGIRQAYETGSGSFQIESKFEIVEVKGMVSIVITEIPYEVIKSNLVATIDKMRIDKTIDGLLEVRDESDRTGLRIVIELKKDADVKAIMTYLMKKTDLSSKYSYNMVAIVDKHPIQMGVLTLLDAYIAHQMDVYTKKTTYDLAANAARTHIVDGLIIAISRIDEVIATIRESTNKTTARTAVQKLLGIDEVQAEAIVMLQLYRLSSTDIVSLQKEQAELHQTQLQLETLLADPTLIAGVIAKDLKAIAKEFGSPRKSELHDEARDYSRIEKPITKEEAMVVVTRDGYLKRASLKSYAASNGALPGLKSGDMVLAEVQASTVDTLLLFTDRGNYMALPIHQLVETKWKEEGNHINCLITLPSEEKIIRVIVIKSFDPRLSVVLATSDGQIKRTLLSEFSLSLFHKPVRCINLSHNDRLVSADISDGASSIVVITGHGMGIRYSEHQVSQIGIRTAGVKAIQKGKNDSVAGVVVVRSGMEGLILMVTDFGAVKFIKTDQLPLSNNRLGKPVEVTRTFKTEPHEIRFVVPFGSSDTRTDAMMDGHPFMSVHFKAIQHSAFGKILRREIGDKGDPQLLALARPGETLILTNQMPAFDPPPPTVKQVIVEGEEDGDQVPTIFDFIDEEAE